MRLAVLDVGSNTVHLLVVDAHPGAAPVPTVSHKRQLRLAEHLRPDGSIAEAGADALVDACRNAVAVSREEGADELLPFATSAVREASNGSDVLARVEAEAGVELSVLTGMDEARLTFLAVRRWFGWSSGRLLSLDIGGGSLEIATGIDEVPDVALSVPLGAGRLTLSHLQGDPPRRSQLEELRKEARRTLKAVADQVTAPGAAHRAVGSSKTFRSLARLTGAAASSRGHYVPRTLRLEPLADWVPRLAAMNAEARSALPGVSVGRSRQLLAGAVVAETAMEVLGVDEVDICPWALREGLILRRLDQI